MFPGSPPSGAPDRASIHGLVGHRTIDEARRNGLRVVPPPVGVERAKESNGLPHADRPQSASPSEARVAATRC
jgi:hypothetical protein